jgi:16S rRNA (cytosine1402-N4)-methyltransferase
MGGHSSELLKHIPNGRLIGLDQDVEALQHARLTLKDPRVTLVKANFAHILNVLNDLHLSEVDSVLMDIGVSSLQLDSPQRGFSFMHDGPLDMRMDASASLTAADVVNTYPEKKLADVIYEFGEERKSRQLANAIVRHREQKPFETTDQLAHLAKQVLGSPRPKHGESAKHPATRLFQALRIEVNHELEVLQTALKDVLSVLKPGGRFAVITFHSLEDRIVKQYFKQESVDCICPPHIPMCICGHKVQVELVTRKPVTASEEELQTNPRSRSAKLRVIQKLAVTA